MRLLTPLAGSWTGTNQFRLMPEDPAFEAPATAQLTVGARGTVAALTYTWSHPDDGPQEGLLSIGSGEEDGSGVALWGDSWHQGPAAQQLRGEVQRDRLTVAYTYAEDWEWRITLMVGDRDLLRWQMDNVAPVSASDSGQRVTSWAMRGELHRTA